MKVIIILSYRFSSFYKKSFYVFVVVYALEIIYSFFLYTHLKNTIPMHIGIGSVDSLTNAKYTIFLLPIVCIMASCVLKSEVVDSKYIEGSPTDNILKTLFFLLQVLLVIGSVYYFYVLSMYYTI